MPSTYGRIWDRPATRRAILAGGVVAAAGGTAAAVVGLGASSVDGNSDTGVIPGLAADGSVTEPAATATSAPTATPTEPVVSDGALDDDRRWAAHLLRRAAFGGTSAQIEEFAALSRDEAASRLIDYESTPNTDLDSLLSTVGLDDLFFTNARPGEMAQWWLLRMAYSSRPLEERMALIWHGLLTTQVSQIGGLQAKLMVRQNDLFRDMALPVYDDLLQAIGKDPAMMSYLNTVESTAEAPNENYGRELMELYSMGEGNYTEDDVREAARAFTGWRFTPPRRVDRDDREAREIAVAEWDPQFIVAQRLHDSGTKTFLGQTGNWDGTDIVDIIMQQEATGQFIALYLYTEFIHSQPYQDEIDDLVTIWNESGHDIKEMVRAILTSDAFYSEEAYRAKVRSPIELMVGTVRGLELDLDIDVRLLQGMVEPMGQIPFEPPNVAGWPGGATWLSSGSFFARVNFIDGLLFGRVPADVPRRVRDRPDFPRGLDGLRVPLLEAAGSAEDTVDLALAVLVDGNVPAESRDAMVEYVASASNAEERAKAAAYLALASPEFQTI